MDPNSNINYRRKIGPQCTLYCTELSTVCSKINGNNFHGLETDKSNSVRLCSYCWAYNIFHLGMAAIRNFCTGLIALVARSYKIETTESRFKANAIFPIALLKSQVCSNHHQDGTVIGRGLSAPSLSASLKLHCNENYFHSK